MAGRADIEAGRAFVTLMLKDQGFAKGMDAAGEKFKSFGKGMGIIGAAIAGAGAAITAPLLEMAREFAEAGAEIFNMSKRTHESVQSLQFLKYAAGETGTEIEKIQQAIFRTQKEGKNFDEVAMKIAAIKDPAKQSQAAIEAFGKKAGPFLVPLLNDLPRLREEFDRLGLAMSDKDVAAAKELETGFFNLTSVIKSARNAIGAALAPTIKEAIGWITNIAVSVRDWVRAHGDLFASALKVGAVLIGVGTAIATLGGVVAASGFAIIGINGALGLLASLFGALISPIGLVVASVAGLATWFATSTQYGRQMVQSLTDWFGELRDFAVDAFGGIADSLAAGNLAAAGQIALAALEVVWLASIRGLKDAWFNFWDEVREMAIRTGLEVAREVSSIFTAVKSGGQGLVAIIGNLGASLGEHIGNALSSTKRTHLDEIASLKETLEKMQAMREAAVGRLSSSKVINPITRETEGGHAAGQIPEYDRQIALAKGKLALLEEEDRKQKSLADDQAKAHEQAKEQIGDEGRAQLEAIDKAQAAVDKYFDSQQDHVKSASTQREKDSKAELDAAMEHLKALEKQAAEERKKHELAGGPKFNAAALGLNSDVLKQQIFGSFSAAALTAGGGQGEPPDVKAIREGNKQRQLILIENRDARIAVQGLAAAMAAHG